MLQGFFKGVHSIIFPRNCQICRRGPLADHQHLCAQCFVSIPWVNPSSHIPLSGITHSWAACQYQEPFTTLIHRFKYNGSTSLKKLFGFLLNHYISTHHLPINDIDLIIPIPLHATKLRERGFNQSLLLATSVGEHFQRPIDHTILERTQLTQSQTALSLKDRWTNQQGTFRITHPLLITGKHVLIVDDLMTSGATTLTAAYELKKAGALRVSILTLAKA